LRKKLKNKNNFKYFEDFELPKGVFIMVHICFLKSCRSEHKRGINIKFHGFPTDFLMRKKWIEVKLYLYVNINKTFDLDNF
jgi:hypothetical protein